FSHPLWLVSRWIDHFGIADTEKLLDHNNRPPQIVLQPIGLTRDELSEKLNGAGYPHDVDPEAPGLALARGVPIGRLPGYDDGHFIVQDRAQARLIEWADVATRSSVWDCCAAPGGKTCLLADGRWVVASDRSRDRLSTLARTLARTRRAADAFAGDATTPPLRDETFDAVLLDAPCSATGTMRRHPDARWRITPKRIASAARLQARLLQSVAGVVKVGGVLIYATCSLEQEENQLQVDAALARDPRFERTKEDLSIFPWHSGTDGVYAARLERVK
ncbi:MAG: RsmB/NOP family class I SAM-dependent RNA methyltransferase, partial [Gemmatimonadales bacterium]